MSLGLTVPALALGSHRQDVCCSVGCLGSQPPLLSKSTLCPFLFQNKVVTVDGVRVKLQVRRDWRGRGVMVGPAPAPHPNHKRPAALPSAWGNFLWGPEETAFVCLMSVEKAVPRHPLFYPRQLNVPSDKLLLASAPHLHQFPRPHMLETGRPPNPGLGKGL